jgi:tight adherence protein C
VTAVVILGFLVGLGLWLAWTGVRPKPEALSARLARFDRPLALTRQEEEDEANADRDTRLGNFMLRTMPWLERMVERNTSALRVVGRTRQQQAAAVASYVLLASILGPWTGFVFWLIGMPLPLVVPLGITILGSAAGLLLPFRALRREAKERRTAFVHALSAWCDVMVMSLAAGRGVEQAMQTASAAGQGWPFREMRAALTGAHVQGVKPWEAFDQLGQELDIQDLSTLASMIAMAGEEGAAVRQTVSAKARTIREKVTAETELESAAMTEAMSLPNVVLVMGFLLFLGFPALAIMFQINR